MERGKRDIYEFFSGSYGKAGEDGIILFRFDPEAGLLEKICAYQGVENPSYLAFNAKKTMLYAVSEQVPEGGIAVFLAEGRELFPVKTLSTKGADPCHVTLDSSERVLFADNYTSGSLAVFRLDAGGIPEELSELVIHEGSGPHPFRQTNPHIHYTKEHQGKIYTVDLGLDQVFIYELDQEKGMLTDTGERIALPPGSGPRHLEFHREKPDVLYVVCELGSQAAVFLRENGKWALKQLLSTLPEDFHGENTASALKMQGNLLFAGNRGHDSIAVFKADKDGMLTLSDIAPSGGRTPRDFTVFGEYLVVANQDSDRISVLKIDWQAGTLSFAGIGAEAVKPSCIRKYREYQV